MAVRILIYRKVRPGKENDLNQVVRERRSKAVHVKGYISGETLFSIEDPSVQLVISAWNSLEDWHRWAHLPERRAFARRTEALLEEPTKISRYQYESIAPDVNELIAGREMSVRDE